MDTGEAGEDPKAMIEPAIPKTNCRNVVAGQQRRLRGRAGLVG